jgi:aminomethyltransferase
MAKGRDLPRCMVDRRPAGHPVAADILGGVIAALVAAFAGPAAAIALSACSRARLLRRDQRGRAAPRTGRVGGAGSPASACCCCVLLALLLPLAQVLITAAALPWGGRRRRSCRTGDDGRMSDLLTGPLHDRHTALGATLGAFGGWSMPISYPDGTVAEHTAVRTDVGVFDVSHLGKLAITGPGAAAFVNRCFTADLDKIGPGQAQYTLCCTRAAGCVDDVIVYLDGPDDVLAVPNAANAATVAELLRAAAPSGIDGDRPAPDLAVLAVQGPRSGELVPGRPGLTWPSSTGRHACLPHRLHRRARLRAAGAVARGGAGVGRPGRGRGAPVRPRRPRHPAHRDGLPPPRPGPHPDITPCRRAAAGRWAGASRSSGAATRWWPRRRRARAAAARAARDRPGCAAAGHGVLADGARVGVTTSGTFSPTLEAGHRAGAARRGRTSDVTSRGAGATCGGRRWPCVVEATVRASHVR